MYLQPRSLLIGATFVSFVQHSFDHNAQPLCRHEADNGAVQEMDGLVFLLRHAGVPHSIYWYDMKDDWGLS